MPARNRSLPIVCTVAAVASAALLAGVFASSSNPDRIINRPGIVVVREKPFYADDLVKSVKFSRIEDRTALNSPGRGYFVFFTSQGELHLAPEAIEARFFFDEFEFPRTMKPSDDLERLSVLNNSLARVVGINEAVSKSLALYVDRVADAVKHLQNDEWWEFPRGWVSREDRDRRTAQAERSAIDTAGKAIKQKLRDASDVGEIEQAVESVGALEKLPATSSGVFNHTRSLAAELRAEADRRLLQLEEAFVEDAQAKLKAALDNARSLQEVLATADSIGDLAGSPLTLPAALAARDACVAKLSALLERKDREMRIKETVFDDLAGWRKALDQSGDLQTASEPELAANLKRSESLYSQAVEVGGALAGAAENLGRFFAGLPAQAIHSGQGLPPPPAATDAALQAYDNFVARSNGGGPVSVGELDEAAGRLKAELALYRQLAGLSGRARRHDLWRARDSFREVLGQMAAVHDAILEEEKKYQGLLNEGRRLEASRNFADASGAYQSAHDIAPSADLAERIEKLKEQDLGL